MLLRKLRKALFNKDFIKWEAKAGEEPVISGEFQATIVALGETGYSLVGPYKLSPNKDLKPSIPELSEAGIKDSPQRTSAIVKSHSAGLFANDITLLGIGEAQTSKIRQFLTKRKI